MSKAKFIAEWEKQQATILAMPHKDSDWKPYLKQAQNKMIEIINHIARFQLVIVLYKYPEDVEKINKISNVKCVQIDTNDTWCRDFMPLSLVKKNKLIFLDFMFNAWGLKYSANLDNTATNNLFNQNIFKNVVLKKKSFILEGGSIETNGGGILLTTSKCLLESNRNFLSKKRIEKKLKNYLNVNRILWLENGKLEGDDTDLHIDNIARFVNKNTIVYLKCEDERDSHYNPLCAMENELKKFRDNNNKPFNLIPLPMPKAIFYKKRRLPASYINFVFVNGALLLPIFKDKNDDIAINIFKKILKDRVVIPIDSSVLIRQGGGLHCLSMQIPSL